MALRIAMVVGEASGDLLAAHLIRAVRQTNPDVSFFGIGGPRMQAEGFEAWWPSERLSVMGYVDVLKRLPQLLWLRRCLLRRVTHTSPDVFVGVDAPDFNLSVERKLRKAGVKTVHYVSPSIWAWRGGRVRKIGRSADHVMCLFPFEPAIYAQHGIPASFVGHPLADVFPDRVDRSAAREKLQLDQAARVVAVLPGSRQGEVGRLAVSMVGAIQILLERHPGIQFLVPLITRETRQIFEQALCAAGVSGASVRLLFGHSHEAMAASDVALVASGTASLEAALLKLPMVIAYRIGSFSYRVLRRLAYLPWVGLPNILAREFLVPELIQDEATPGKLADAVSAWLSDEEARKRLIARFDLLHQELRQGNAEKAAAVVLAVART